MIFPHTVALFKARAFPCRDTHPCNSSMVRAELPGPYGTGVRAE